MDERMREFFLEWSETKEFRRLVARTLEEMRGVLAGYRKVLVNVSGGKDSLVALHLARRVRRDVWVFHWDHGPWLIPREVEDDVLECIYSIAPRSRVIVRRMPSRGESDRWEYQRWYRAFFGNVKRIVREYGFELVILGLRGEESVQRRIRTSKVFEYDRSTGQLLYYPIREWTWRDVWAYIVSNNIRYPRVYDVYCPVLGWDKCRLVTFHDREFDKIGSPNIDGVLMWRYKHQT